jgi:hypothetical protein
MPLLLYLPVQECCFIMFGSVVPCSKCYFYLHTLEQFYDFLISFLLYVNIVHFDFQCCGSISVFCFCRVGCYLFCLYYNYYVMCFL